MDVTQQYLATVLSYNGSDSTEASHLASTTRLNYASGPTYREAVEQNVYQIPYTLDYHGSLGLEGVENIYVRINHDPQSVDQDVCIEEKFWQCMVIWDTLETELLYDGAVFDTATPEAIHRLMSKCS